MESLEIPHHIVVPSIDLPTIQESAETPMPMMLVGIGIAVIAIMVVGTGIVLWKMFASKKKPPNDEEIPIDEPLTNSDDKEEGDDPTALNLRSRKVNRE